MKCTTSQRHQFEAEGFVQVNGVLSKGDVVRATEAMDRVYGGEYGADRRPPRQRGPMPVFGNESSVQWILNARVLDQTLWELATMRELGEMAASLLGSRSVSIIEDQLLCKPGHGLPVNMHQDRSYWPFSSSHNMVTCWIALMDMTEDLGRLEFVRGSHLWGLSERRPNELMLGTEAEWMSAVEASRPDGREVELVAPEVRAGDGVYFHSLTFHGSRRNLSGRPRKALSLHWAAEECRVDLGQTSKVDFPYFFARLVDGGPIANAFMPVVYTDPGVS